MLQEKTFEFATVSKTLKCDSIDVHISLGIGSKLIVNACIANPLRGMLT